MDMHDSQDSRGKGRLFPLYHFDPLHGHFLVGKLLQRAYFYTYLVARLEPRTFGFQAQVANH